jgi:hypothetical protein
MAKNPSTRWFFNDWMGDLGLRRCSLAARGLWADMLALCANAQRYGYLEADDGKKLSIAELARQVGAARGTVDRLLHELEGNHVFSRDEAGTIFNRRMVRETAEAAQKTKGGTRKKTDRERDARQLDLLNDCENARTRACDCRLQASRIPDSLEATESLDGAREGEKIDQANPLSSLRSPLPADVEPADHWGDPFAPVVRGGAVFQPFGGAASPDFTRRDSSAVERRAEDPCDGGSIPSLGAFTPIGDHCPPRAPPCKSRQKPEKSPALKARIKQQLMAKHCRFLQEQGRADEVGAYWAAQLGDDAEAAQQMLDDVDRRMRRARWDDMSEWKRQVGIAA